jgi:uncharacterized RDD family membrane protein YckC
MENQNSPASQTAPSSNSLSVTTQPAPQTPVTAQNPTSKTAQGDNQYAGIGRRFVASVIDGLIVGIISAVLSLPTTYMANQQSVQPMGLMLQILSYVLGAVYYVYFIGKSGQTLGKKAMGVKVVKLETGVHPDYVGAFLREVVGKILSSIVFGLGYLWAVWDDKKQTWHDKIAGTIVVRT